MIASKSAQTFELNSEIAESITKCKAKDREWNRDEHDQLFCKRNKEFDLRCIDPGLWKMIVDPLRTADEINRQCEDKNTETSISRPLARTEIDNGTARMVA